MLTSLLSSAYQAQAYLGQIQLFQKETVYRELKQKMTGGDLQANFFKWLLNLESLNYLFDMKVLEDSKLVVFDFNKLEDYMLQNSYKGLVDKVNLASGNRQFMYNYSVNVLMNFPDEPQFERNTNGHVIDNAVVNFSAVFDFWINSNYILEIKSEKKLDDYPEIDVFEDSNMKYEYLIPTHFIKEHLSENMHMILNKPFVPDINEEVDELGFGVILNKELKNVIKVIRDKGLDLDKILEVKVLIDNRELDKNLYDVDWKNYNLKTHKPLSNVTYVFLLYGDMKKIHTINNLILENQLDKIDSLGYDKV